MMRWLWLGLGLLVTLGQFPLWAAPARSDHAEAELVAAVGAVQPGQNLTVALRLKLDEGWHSYWQNPGDSGLATTLQWQLPQGLSAGPIQWPYPEYISTPPLATYGYEGEIFLLTQIKVPARLNTKTLTLTAKTEWLECKEECLPGLATLRLTLPVGTTAPPSPWT
ncbi:protein-disulfide reductase DsbD domain-containing protein, partial [Candidatus Cyanaurora vandensis]